MISLLFALFGFFESANVIYCDIKGNVENPGVYEMKQGEVINDLIERAGGLKKASYIKNINLSKRLYDEMVVYIFSSDEYEDITYVCPKCECDIKECVNTTHAVTEPIKEEKNTMQSTSKIITNHIPTTSKVLETTTKIIITTEDSLININTASVDELMELNGIGEKIALKIISYREENEFESIDDIKNVSGIGESLFAKIKDYITV